MPDNRTNEEIVQRFASDSAITQAVRRAVRAAVLSHKQAGNTVAAWQESGVVLIAPEDIQIPQEEETTQEITAPVPVNERCA